MSWTTPVAEDVVVASSSVALEMKYFAGPQAASASRTVNASPISLDVVVRETGEPATTGVSARAVLSMKTLLAAAREKRKNDTSTRSEALV
jgi:hypothetical protein